VSNILPGAVGAIPRSDTPQQKSLLENQNLSLTVVDIAGQWVRMQSTFSGESQS